NNRMISSLISFTFRLIFTPRIFWSLLALQKIDIQSVEEKKKHQYNKLKKVLKTSFEHISYYNKINLTIDLDNISYKDFQKIPVLTKNIIRTRGQELFNNDFSKIQEVYKNSSGGSTGEPVQFYQTKDQGIRGAINYFYALFLNGVNPYEKSVDLWGAERDMYNTKRKFNIRAMIYNKTTLNTFVLNDK